MERPKYGFASWPAEQRSAFLREIALAHPIRGFALLPKARRVEVARRGGQNAHQPGRGGHEWTAAEARSAGRQGGLASGRARRARAEAIAHTIAQIEAEGEAISVPLEQAARRLVHLLAAQGIVLSVDRAAARLRRHRERLLRESDEKENEK